MVIDGKKAFTVTLGMGRSDARGQSHRASSVGFIMDPKNLKSPPTEVHTVADCDIIL